MKKRKYQKEIYSLEIMDELNNINNIKQNWNFLNDFNDQITQSQNFDLQLSNFPNNFQQKFKNYKNEKIEIALNQLNEFSENCSTLENSFVLSEGITEETYLSEKSENIGDWNKIVEFNLKI